MPPAISRKEGGFLYLLVRRRVIWIPILWINLEFFLIPLRRFVDASRDKPERRPLSVLSLQLPRSRVFAGWSIWEGGVLYLSVRRQVIWIPMQWIDIEFFLIPLRRFVDASRDKPERRPLSVLSLRLPRSRVFAGWSICKEAHFVIRDKTCSL